MTMAEIEQRGAHLDPGEKVRIIPDLPFAEYCAIPAMNISTLLKFVGRTDCGAKWVLDHDRAETDALLVGHAAHAAILEPDVFADIYAIAPAFGDLRTKAAKEARADWELANAGKAHLTSDQAAEVAAMKQALDECQDPEIRELFDGDGQNELSGLFRDEATQVLCKFRIDRATLLHGYRVLLDLKTDKDITDRGIETSFGQYRYHVRMAWYMDAMSLVKPTDWMGVWVWLGKPVVKDGQPSEAYEVRATQIDEEHYDEGRKVYRECLDRYARCQSSGIWRSFRHGIEVVNPPPWAYRAKGLIA